MSTEKDDQIVSIDVIRAVQMKIINATYDSRNICGWVETRKTLKYALELFPEDEQKRQDMCDSYLNELGDPPYIEERGRYFHDGFDSFDDNDDSSLKFVSGKRGES